jgi:AraC family transcriptional regulator of adaptative response/methylated-DNA-[protein]-cysteine methyltransferase
MMKNKNGKDSDYKRIESAIRFILKHKNEQPALDEIAKAVGLSEFHFQRLFRRWAGVSPKSFLQYLTITHAKSLLLKKRDLLHASHTVGLSGPGRLHDLFVKFEAMTPGEFKLQGEGLTIEYGITESPFGPVLIGVTKRGVCHFHFVNVSKKTMIKEMKKKWAKATFHESQKAADDVCKKIFSPIKKNKKEIQILAAGTPFQLKVWEALLTIPEGALMSYQDIADLIDRPKSARAVGSAIGANSIGCLIPCHRVIKSSGVVGEYRWGTLRKHALIGLESSLG